MIQISTINWDYYESPYLTIKPGEKKALVLSNFRSEEIFNKPALAFDVLEENGEPSEKLFSVTNRQLIRALRPFILEAESQGRNNISVQISRSGAGMTDTSYSVKAVTPLNSSSPSEN